MPTKSKSKSDHKKMWLTNFKFVVDFTLLWIGMILPVIIFMAIFRIANRQFPVWMIGPLLVTGVQIWPIFGKVLLITKPVPIQKSIRDSIVVILAVWIFFFISFAPLNASNENSCGFIFLTFFSGAGLALGFGYLFGSADLKKKIRDFPRNFKRAKKKK
jgi:hypothetical protein